MTVAARGMEGRTVTEKEKDTPGGLIPIRRLSLQNDAGSTHQSPLPCVAD